MRMYVDPPLLRHNTDHIKWWCLVIVTPPGNPSPDTLFLDRVSRRKLYLGIKSSGSECIDDRLSRPWETLWYDKVPDQCPRLRIGDFSGATFYACMLLQSC